MNKDVDLIQSIKERFVAEMPFFCWDKEHFLRSLRSEKGVILDVGCGNNGPIYTKSILSNWFYIGIDVQDYNQSGQEVADRYTIVDAEEFSSEVGKYSNFCDAVVSTHNLEHCNDREGVLVAMAKALRIGGKLLITFPTENSVKFPSRAGCLNYFDDATHKKDPPNFSWVVSTLRDSGLHIIYATTHYQPPLSWILGLQNEEQSIREMSIKEGTWALWGFETIIWAERR